MVEPHPERLDDVFHALCDSTRRDMLQRLSRREHTVSELAEPFAMSLAAASKHIRTLEAAGLISRTIEGRVHRCRLEPSVLMKASRWFQRYEKFWNGRLDALERALREAP